MNDDLTIKNISEGAEFEVWNKKDDYLCTVGTREGAERIIRLLKGEETL